MEATRRGFVGAAAALAGAAALGPKAYAEEATPERTWDRECDVVVVGAGSGMAAAAAAAHAGMDVIVLEKRSSVGGAMKFSGGNAWLCNTEFSQPNGDSYEFSKTYLDHMQMGMDNEELVEAYLNNCQRVVDVFRECDVAIKPLPCNGQYQPNWEGADVIGRSVQVMGDNDGSDISEAGGFRLCEALTEACDAQGAQILTETRGRRLVITHKNLDGAPEVVGIVAEDADGNEIAIKANKGVILATGGFEWNKKLVETFVRVPLYGGISWPTNEGDGLLMAQSVGAELSMMAHTFGMPNYKAHYEYALENGQIVCMSGNVNWSLARSIIVDQTARRFCREDSGYMSRNNCFGGYLNYGDEGYAADPAWWICDQKCLDDAGGINGRLASWGFPYPSEEDLPESDWVYSADTLEELAEKIGLDPRQLTRTFDEYNEFAAQGSDPLFHRGETGSMGNAPIPLETIDQPPYYAAAIVAGTCGTVGGPRLNANAQVMHASGEPVRGLYAMGNCAGVGGPGPSYGGEGGTLGPAFVFGIIAVDHLASL